MGGGGAPPGQLATYPTEVTAWIGAIDGSLSLTADLTSAMNVAFAHNPFTGLSAYNPSTDVAAAKTALDAFRDNVALLDPDVDVESYIGQATTKYDSTVNSEAKIAALVTAHDDATEAAYQRRVSGGNVGMWMQGAFMTTQFGIQGMLVAAERGHELAELRARLDLTNFSSRVQTITEFARMMLQERLATVQSSQAVFGASFEYAKLKATAMDDYTQMIAELESKLRTWDLNVLNDGTAIMMSVLGTQLTPRALTKSERRAAALGTALNTALQFGGATNPGAGILAGLGSLGIAALANRGDA